jgi:anti-sigma factor RsiW
MSMEQNRSQNLEALQRLLDGYGADRTRWPAPERLRFASLLAEDSEARRMVAEAAALDRLIDLAPLVGDDRRKRLVDRIVARAASEPRVPGGIDIVGRRHGGGDRASRPTTGRPERVLAQWPAAMLMAASLALGIFAGTTNTVERVIAPWTVVVGLRSIDGDPLRTALGDEIGSAGVEELL